MEKTKKPFYKRWWFFVFAFLFMLVMGNLNTGNKAKNAPAPKQEKAEETTIEDVFVKATNAKEYTINEGNGYLEITYTLNKTPYDYTDYVSQALTHLLEVATAAFKGETTQIRMDMKADGDIVTSLILSKDGYNKHSWKDITYTEGIYNDIVGDFDKFYVESMLMNNIDPDKIMIKSTLEE